MTRVYEYVIVGGGMAAAHAVRGIRQVDPNGLIAVVSAEADPPYRRPMLTKGLWRGKPVADLWYGTEAEGAELFLDRQVVSVDAINHSITDHHGESFRYVRLLLAPGGTPRRLPFRARGDVLYYRTYSHYCRLKDLVDKGERFAVIGGGFIGSEIAASLALQGKQVTVVFPEPALCEPFLPPHLAQSLNAYYEARGVAVLPRHKPVGIHGGAGRQVVQLDNDRSLVVDGVVAGIGIVPNTALALDAGLEVEDGIRVDEWLCTAHPHVYAVGDAVSFPDAVLGTRRRVEHEDNAARMGETAGRNMAGERVAYRHLPSFYSDFFDLGYEAVGEFRPGHERVGQIERPEDTGVVFSMHDRRVRGVLLWNLFGHVDAARDLIAQPGPHSAASIEDWARERLGDACPSIRFAA